jgi:hypothetical protein
LILGAALLALLVGVAVTIARRPSPAPPRPQPWNPEQPAGTFSLGRALVPALIWGASVAGGVALFVRTTLQQLQQLK